MTTNVGAGSNNALFVHQMIPHHQNAVNMAKALLKAGVLFCQDVQEESDHCTLYVMMHEIINSQNYQIQVMNGLLEANEAYPFRDDCEVLKPKSVTAPGGRERKLDGHVCTTENNVFTVKVDLFAGELGYYKFEECGDEVNPTIGIEIGETYTFVQKDLSNYFHPIGFAYFADGAHKNVDELEPGITQTDGNTCAQFLTVNCSAPMYFLGGESLGVYNNIPEQGNLTTGEEDFGLDAYEPQFFHPFFDWAGYGEFSVKLRFTDEEFEGDLFYFCHVSERYSLLDKHIFVKTSV